MSEMFRRKINPYCHSVDKNEYGTFQGQKKFLDVTAHLIIYDVVLRCELKRFTSPRYWKSALNQLIQYRKIAFKNKHHTPTLFCIITPTNLHWQVQRAFWQYGFGVSVVIDNIFDKIIYVSFPPNGHDSNTFITLTNPEWLPDLSELPNEKKKIVTILKACNTPLWNLISE